MGLFQLKDVSELRNETERGRGVGDGRKKGIGERMKAVKECLRSLRWLRV